MSGSPKQKQSETTEDVVEEREVYLRDGRKLVVSESGNHQLVEIRNESGLLELRIKLTEEGPVLQMESIKLELKAADKIELESKQVSIKATEQLDLDGGTVNLRGEGDVNIKSPTNEVIVRGKMIRLN